VIIHEVAHGYTAELFGDPTPRLQGRLTLNPLKHLEWFGSVVVPIITSLAGFTFGWAKPVEYNPYNIKNKRIGELCIALAGPVSNLLLAIIFGLLIRFIINGSIFANHVDVLAYAVRYVDVFSYIVIINLVLAIFNLIPVPPLDGSKMLFVLLSQQYGRLRRLLESYAPIFVIIAVFLVWEIVYPIVPIIFKFITGVGV
jgi:Zn-dependent protease